MAPPDEGFSAVEFRPVPHRAPLAGRLWLIVAGAILLPVILLVVMPAVLGLHRYVVSSDAMAGSIGRGSLIFADREPVSSLKVGDVISFDPPGDPGDMVTREVASVGQQGIRTRVADGSIDTWTLPVTSSADRMVVHVPLLGYPFLGSVDRTMWLLLASVPLAAIALAVAGDVDRTRRLRRPAVLPASGRDDAEAPRSAAV
jgi:signal peptidase I